MDSDHITKLYDNKGKLIGVLLSPEAWEVARDKVMPAFGEGEPKQEERPEPLDDWETLKQYWDYSYPVDTDVHCDICGSDTKDWTLDEPRRFRLCAANLGGLVTFQCQQCKAKVVKRHFKDQILTETKPYQDKKDSKCEARYDT